LLKTTKKKEKSSLPGAEGEENLEKETEVRARNRLRK